MLIQIQYKIPSHIPFDHADLSAWREDWILGRSLPPGVSIKALDWDKTDETPRQWLLRHKHDPGSPGVVARYAQRNQTFCDYDTPRHQGTIANIFRVARCIGIKPKWMEYRRTRRGWHLVIEWNRKFKPSETVMLQAILGSDLIREMFNATRVLSGKAERNRRWNLLFDRKVL